MTTRAILVLLLLGGVSGWYFGRSWAEETRAERDTEKFWKAHQNYRKKSGLE